jgi:hypothetical protein
VDMARHRFGSGEYRYFTHDLRTVVAALRAALYPRLLPIALDRARRLGRPAPWPDSLQEWLKACHTAGQDRSARILPRPGEGDRNALHRDVFGDLLFPLQVVVGLDEYGTDPGVHHPGPPGPHEARPVGRSDAARREHRPLRPPPRTGALSNLSPDRPRRRTSGRGPRSS